MADSKGRTALHHSALYGDEEMLQLCCTYCKNLNIQDQDDETPLMQCYFAGKPALANILLRKGADDQLKSATGMTAADYARQYQEDHAKRAW